MPCIFTPPSTSSRMVAFYRDLEVREEITVMAGEDIVLRCQDVGKYRLEGSQRRRCVGGHFDGRETKCVGLNQMYDYKIDKPPTILFRHKVRVHSVQVKCFLSVSRLLNLNFGLWQHDSHFSTGRLDE